MPVEAAWSNHRSYGGSVAQALGETIESSVELKRILGLKDLIVYGIVLIMPIAPIPLFGLYNTLAVHPTR